MTSLSKFARECKRKRIFGRTRRAEAGAGAVLQCHRPTVDRSGTDDPHADRGLLLWHPLGTAAVRGGPSEPRLPLVLPAGARRRSAAVRSAFAGDDRQGADGCAPDEILERSCKVAC